MRYRCPWCSDKTTFETEDKIRFLGHAMLHPAAWQVVLDAASQKPEEEPKKIPDEKIGVKK